jgi:16S rRNA (adenine1518-N6/adenine1519-N6)-dimethyltransferase
MKGFPPPRKRFGQHFLADRNVLERIAAALAVPPGATVLEVGPGRGALTDILAERAARLVAIEVDRELVRYLAERYRDKPQVQIVEADALAVDWEVLAGGPYYLAGNLPYYITTPLLFRALQAPQPERAVFVIQEEVARRAVAQAGARDYGALSVNIQLRSRPYIVGRVPAGAFYPRPQVDSAILVLERSDRSQLSPEERDAFSRFTKDLFGMRRKQLGRVLRQLWRLQPMDVEALLQSLGIDPSARAETLSPEEILRLFLARPLGTSAPGEIGRS